MNLKKFSLSLGVMILSAVTIYAGDGYTDSLNKLGIDSETFSSMPAEKQALYSNIEVDSVKSQSKYYKLETEKNSRTAENFRTQVQKVW